MGITGLLPLLKSVARPIHIDSYAGRSVAVDAYSWIHKGIYGSALDIYLAVPNNKFVDYCIHRAKYLIAHHVKPILVFDGGHLPMKSHREKSRLENREKAKLMVEKALRAGDKSTAWQYANKCVDVTSDLAYELIKALRKEGIDYLVAPYEADAQMAYLSQIGMVDAVITEDSDLILFGCQKILFKMGADGFVEEISVSNIFESNDELDFRGFTLSQLRQMCILSGCDYIGQIPKMGLKTAHRFISTYGQFDAALRAIQLSSQYSIPADYEKEFKKAELTFLYQRVYDPIRKAIVHLNDIPEGLLPVDGDWSFLGKDMDSFTATEIALGQRCPIQMHSFNEVDDRKSISIVSRISSNERISLKRKGICPPSVESLKNHASDKKMTISSRINENLNIFQGSSNSKSLSIVNLPSMETKRTGIASPYFQKTGLSEPNNDSNILPPESDQRHNRNLMEDSIDDPNKSKFNSEDKENVPLNTLKKESEKNNVASKGSLANWIVPKPPLGNSDTNANLLNSYKPLSSSFPAKSTPASVVSPTSVGLRQFSYISSPKLSSKPTSAKTETTSDPFIITRHRKKLGFSSTRLKS